MRQILNSESTYVRVKTEEYIAKLEEENNKLKEMQKPLLSPQQELALKLFDGGIDAITTHKELLALETKELNDKIEE